MLGSGGQNVPHHHTTNHQRNLRAINYMIPKHFHLC